MPSKNKFISFRITAEVDAEVRRRAQVDGLTANAFAHEALLDRLSKAEEEVRGWVEVYEELRRLRADLALAAEAILTLTGRGDNAREKAAQWVRNNLNR